MGTSRAKEYGHFESKRIWEFSEQKNMELSEKSYKNYSFQNTIFVVLKMKLLKNLMCKTTTYKPACKTTKQIQDEIFEYHITFTDINKNIIKMYNLLKNFS